jgi:hypothetical protein
MIPIVPVPSLPLVLTKADHHFRAHDTRPGENIDDFQAARLGRAGGVETNPKEGAVATGKQTFVDLSLFHHSKQKKIRNILIQCSLG